jgi:hypothetical protein
VMIDCCATCYDVRSRGPAGYSADKLRPQSQNRKAHSRAVPPCPAAGAPSVLTDFYCPTGWNLSTRRPRFSARRRAPVSLGLPSAGGVTGYGGRGAVSGGTMSCSVALFRPFDLLAGSRPALCRRFNRLAA